MPRDKHRRISKSKSSLSSPQIDPLTVVWVTTIATTLMCEVGAGATRIYVRYVDPHARLLEMFSAYLLLTAAVRPYGEMRILHIATRADWEAAQASGRVRAMWRSLYGAAEA